jgi:hypothetical protein
LMYCVNNNPVIRRGNWTLACQSCMLPKKLPIILNAYNFLALQRRIDAISIRITCKCICIVMYKYKNKGSPLKAYFQIFLWRQNCFVCIGINNHRE